MRDEIRYCPSCNIPLEYVREIDLYSCRRCENLYTPRQTDSNWKLEIRFPFPTDETKRRLINANGKNIAV